MQSLTLTRVEARQAEKSLWVVACAYAMSAHELTIKLERLAARLGVIFRGVIVDNRLAELPQNNERWTYVAGSNRDHDFSAYVEGWECSVAAGVNPDNVLFLNDSLFTLHPARTTMREVVSHAELLGSLAVPAICGKTDRYAMLCHRSPWSGLPVYVSSYCFLLNRQALGILQALVGWADADGLTHDRAIHESGWGAGLAPNFRELIRAYMSYGHPTFVWPGLRRYRVDDKLIASKARCIYLEHRLSGEIARDGCLVSINMRTIPRQRLYWEERLMGAWRNFLYHRRRGAR